jgi:hypothetical protein
MDEGGIFRLCATRGEFFEFLKRRWGALIVSERIRMVPLGVLETFEPRTDGMEFHAVGDWRDSFNRTQTSRMSWCRGREFPDAIDDLLFAG